VTVPEFIDRRSFLRRSAVGAAGLAAAGLGGGGLLEACSSSKSNARTLGPRDGITTATPKRGGKLVFAVEAEQSSLDPATARFDESGVNYARAIYDPLTIIAADGSVQPYLAHSVTPNADHTQWTITTRPGVFFHDGSVCDAQAIANSMNHVIHGLLGTVTLAPVVDNVVATGPSTVTVSLKQPWVPFDYYLAGGIGGQVGYIVGPSVIAQSSGTNQVKPVGTGPFKYVSWVPNEHLELERNPNYWRSPLPYLDQLTFRPIVDPDSRANSLLAGTVDIMHTDVASTIMQFRDNQGFGFIDDLNKVIGEPDMDFVLLNTQQPPLDDLRVRQAMAMSLNLQDYRSVINHDLNPISTQPFVPNTPYYATTTYPSYNPSMAKSLIDQVKASTGKKVSFTLGTTTSGTAVQAAELLQSQFQQAGMEVTLATFQQSDLINNALSGKFEAYEWRQWAAVDPDLNYLFWSPTTIFPPLHLATNFARYANPLVETYLQQGRTSSNPFIRAEAYRKIAEIFAQDLPYIVYDRAVWSVIAGPRVQNFANPTTPAGGTAYGMIVGTIWPTQIWMAT
jgi:peptide/nickel transport system substrate-binding protein